MELQQKPGIAFGKRGDFIDAHLLRSGFVSTVEGQACSVDSEHHAYMGLAILNSHIFQYGINAYCGQHKYAGYVNRFPVPDLNQMTLQTVTRLSKSIVDLKEQISATDETAPLFICYMGSHGNRSSVLDITDYFYRCQKEIQQHEKTINCMLHEAYNLKEESIKEIEQFCKAEPSDKIWDDSQGEAGHSVKYTIIDRLLSNYIGFLFCRWDIRIARDPSLVPAFPDPFAPLPVCPPGMLVSLNGLPAQPGGIVSEEWLKARLDASSLPPEGSVTRPTIPDADYPLRISWDGILVDDPGISGNHPHREDIIRRIREVLHLLWGDRSQAIEQEACEILGVSDLRDYFRRPASFFADHLKRYSKSRRKAPIYWPISTASGSYTIWLYYHRLNDQTLYTVTNHYLEPKIAEVELELSRIEQSITSATGHAATDLRDRFTTCRTLLAELRELREELLRIAALPYKPNLNDGVIINAAPFHKLFRLRSWAKETEECWKKLENGDYDWAHMAYTLWPDRVRDVCKKDRSIAIAHGLEDLCETAPPSSSAGAGGKKRKSKEPGDSRKRKDTSGSKKREETSQ